MAEILVKAVSATHPDAVKDARGCYKQGDPVVVMPDGHAWGAEERLPRFWLVKVPGATVAQLESYIAQLRDQNGDTIRRRAWGATKLTGSLRNQLNATGTVTVTLAQVQSVMERKA